MPGYNKEGGCACGQVRFRVTREPMFVNQCHCTLCQRQTGAPFAVNLFVESENVQVLSGETAQSDVATGSGGVQSIIRCAACGTAVWSHYGALGSGCTAVRAGCLDVPGDIVPDAEIYTASRWPWVGASAGVPAFETYYKPSTLLPEGRFARLKAVLEKKAQA